MSEKLIMHPVTDVAEEADAKILDICQWAKDVAEKYHCAVELPMILLEGRVERAIDSLHANW